jgi:DNA-binding NarL/FixJ family response regulator
MGAIGRRQVTGHSCAGGAHPVRRSPDIRILLVDDHPWVRASLAELLSDEDDLVVVGECADGADVVAAAERLQPDVVLMDLSMPGMNGVEATNALRAAHLDSRVVVLTAEDSAARTAVEAAGADALLPKTTRADALLGCLRTVVVGCGCCRYCL